MALPTFVAFNDMATNAVIEVNVDATEIAELSAVPTAQLPNGVADATYIRFSSGLQIAVRGTVAATQTAMNGGLPATPCAVISANAFVKQNGGFQSITHPGTGQWVITMAAAYPATSVAIFATVLNNASRIINAQQAGPSTFNVNAYSDAGVAADCDFQVLLIPGLS